MAIQAVEQLTPKSVLAELHACNHTEKAAAARRLKLAVIWAELHPAIADQPYDKVVDSLTDETTGATVAAIAEFAAVHGVSTNTGRQLIGDAVTLHTRLPRCWQQMTDLRLPAWKARLLAQTAHGLGDEAVDWLDRHAAILGAKLGVRTIKRLALTAIARFEPDRLPNPETRRWVRINTDTDTLDGASWLDGRLDTPDALDLEAALRFIAADLAAGGEDDLDLRRAQALGVMARRTLGQPELPTEAATTDQPNAGARVDAEPGNKGPTETTDSIGTREADVTDSLDSGDAGLPDLADQPAHGISGAGGRCTGHQTPNREWFTCSAGASGQHLPALRRHTAHQLRRARRGRYHRAARHYRPDPHLVRHRRHHHHPARHRPQPGSPHPQLSADRRDTRTPRVTRQNLRVPALHPTGASGQTILHR